MVTEGLPIRRQERGAQQDIIAGADFLSVLMESPAARQAYKELTTVTSTSTTNYDKLRIPSNGIEEDMGAKVPIVRESRIPRSTTAVAQAFTKPPAEFGAQDNLDSNRTRKVQTVTVDPINESSDSSQLNTSLIISVEISSSEGDSHINKFTQDIKPSINSTDLKTSNQIISVEDHPSLIAEVNKSEFSVEETEPITSNSGRLETYTEYPANVQPLNNPSNPHLKDKLQPFEHHSVIFHTNPKDPNHGRSVSYSTVIQALPKQPDAQAWEDSNKNYNERQDRHYEIKERPVENSFTNSDSKHKGESNLNLNITNIRLENQPAENTQHFIMSNFGSSINKNKDWMDQERGYPKNDTESSEKNWEVDEKEEEKRGPLVYGAPEQNYEVDESVSVMSNGRVHGVQPFHSGQTTPTIEVKKDATNDNQKVGYVVEGRNYRKYRVEERTSDGFIVGEYGVVSHNDGSLRGVRYTADGTINPRLIYDALMKFLSL